MDGSALEADNAVYAGYAADSRAKALLFFDRSLFFDLKTGRRTAMERALQKASYMLEGKRGGCDGFHMAMERR